MRLCKCERGHFYDQDKNPVCPHCAQMEAQEVIAEDDPTTAYTEEASPEDLPYFNEDIDSSNYGAENDVYVEEEYEEYETEYSDENEVPETEQNYEEYDDCTVAFVDEMVNEVAAEMSEEEDIKRPSALCVGWLVALNGAHVGQDFRLKTGKNFIGRGENMDIALTGDKSVSRDRHAIIIYEPRKHTYLIQPGESSGLVYRNDDLVLDPVQIEAHDKITVGDVDLLFIPLCSENFNWENQLENMKNEK